jgi:hypothetical protein
MVVVVKYQEPISSADNQRPEAAVLEIEAAEGFGAVNRKPPGAVELYTKKATIT